MSLSFDQDVLDIDLPMLRNKLDSNELQVQIKRAFKAIEANPTHAEELDYQLSGYRSYKVHSELNPARGKTPDLRLVYRIETTSLHIIALRERPDVYLAAKGRVQRHATGTKP